MQRDQKRCPSSVPSNHLQSCHLPTFCWGPSQRDEASCSYQARSKVKALRSSPSQPRARAQGNLDTYFPGTNDMQRSDEERGASQGGSVAVPVGDGHPPSQLGLVRDPQGDPTNVAGGDGYPASWLVSRADAQGDGMDVGTGRAFPPSRLDRALELTWHARGPQRAKYKAEIGKSSQQPSEVLKEILKDLDKSAHRRDDATPVRDEPMEADSIAFKPVSEKEKQEKEKPKAKLDKTKRKAEVAVLPKRDKIIKPAKASQEKLDTDREESPPMEPAVKKVKEELPKTDNVKTSSSQKDEKALGSPGEVHPKVTKDHPETRPANEETAKTGHQKETKSEKPSNKE
ncbi:uncharacterized protein LJ206_002270, partial [Theristicus caerulescens]